LEIWEIDKIAGIVYNSLCQFEVMLMNMNIVIPANQWGIDETDAYVKKYKKSIRDEI